VPICIDHVGSTLPNCAANDIIDIDVIFNNDIDFIVLKKLFRMQWLLPQWGSRHHRKRGV
jgi:GrpB-like predicted nucleotidyltransferase (UPF0157 family)